MNDKKRLTEKLGKLAADTDEIGLEGRRLASEAGADVLRAALLKEIDETILPRLLTFRNRDGDALALEVAGRRLLRVRAAPEGSVAVARVPALTAPIGAEDAGQCALLATVLVRFLGDGGSLAVTASPLDRRPDPSNVGRSPDALAISLSSAGEIPPDEDETAEPESGDDRIARFLKQSAPGALAWIRLSPAGIAESGGDDEAKALLSGLVPESIADVARELGPEATGRCLVLMTDGAALFYGADGTDDAVAVLSPGERVQTLLAEWAAAEPPA